MMKTLLNWSFKDTENLLKQEAHLTDIPEIFSDASDSVLQAYQSEGVPDSYDSCYTELRKFVDSSLDDNKVSFQTSLVPANQAYNYQYF